MRRIRRDRPGDTKGGFTVALSPARRAEWEALATAALAARDAAQQAEPKGP
jgi:hypothetical protein